MFFLCRAFRVNGPLWGRGLRSMFSVVRRSHTQYFRIRTVRAAPIVRWFQPERRIFGRMTKNDAFMLHGSIRATSGNGDALADILAEAETTPMPGCRLYVVSRDEECSDTVWVTEIWESETDHQASLHLNEVRERIQRAMPIIDRDGMTQQRLNAIAGIPQGI